MKKDSLTSKNVGERVERGEFLGIMGSSGNSGSPHLHFMVRDSSGQLIDPFVGSCNSTISRSWWDSQLPYNEAGVNQVTIGNAVAEISRACSGDDLPPEKQDPHTSENFQSGGTVYCNGYFRHISRGQTAEWRIYQPDGSLYKKLSDWTFNHNTYDFASRWWNYRSFTLPFFASKGTWRCEITFEDEAYSAYFNVNDPTCITINQPNGNEAIAKGQSYAIRWSDNVGGNVRIDLYKSGTYHSNIASSTASNGTYQWVVSQDIPDSSNYTVRITNVAVPGLYDKSNATFTIQSPNSYLLWTQ